MTRRRKTVAELIRERAAGNGRRHPPADPCPEAERGDAYEGDPPPAPAAETFSAAELVAMRLPEPHWAVEGILPAGLSVLAGKPKLGKSWLALLLALAVAGGGVALGSVSVEAGDVLYLALEDTRRRLQDRLRKLLAKTEAPAPPRLTLATAWPRQDKGGLAALGEWLQAHGGAALVAIDTWQRFRPLKMRGRDIYEEDYEHAGEVKALADRHGAAVLVLHHCRKMEAADPIDSVSGSVGTTGAADAVLVLKRERGQHDATLFLAGRDVEERELALSWDPAHCLWSALGQADEYRLTRERGEVMDLLRAKGEPLSPAEVAPLIGKTPGACKALMWRLQQGGWLDSDGGRYSPRAREQ
jgi:hypothetical protein